MTTNNRLATLPALPQAPKARPTHGCACGCNTPTARTFAPGHDARQKGLIIRVIRGVMTLEGVAEWGGQAVADATEAAMGNPALMKRWGLHAEVAAWMEAQTAPEAEEAAS